MIQVQKQVKFGSSMEK